jgi:hypothetical protein
MNGRDSVPNKHRTTLRHYVPLSRHLRCTLRFSGSVTQNCGRETLLIVTSSPTFSPRYGLETHTLWAWVGNDAMGLAMKPHIKSITYLLITSLLMKYNRGIKSISLDDPLCLSPEAQRHCVYALIEKTSDNEVMRRKSLITKAPHCHVIAFAHTQRGNEPINFDNDHQKEGVFQTTTAKH